MSGTALHIARAKTDARDWLIEADEPLASLQLRIGGELPGIVAAPALLELVRKSRLYGLRLARAIRAQDDAERVTAWAEVAPDPEGEGCVLSLSNWQAVALLQGDSPDELEHRREIARQLAEFSARLGPGQEVLSAETGAPDLAGLVQAMREGAGRPWTDFVLLEGKDHRQPMHWRLGGCWMDRS